MLTNKIGDNPQRYTARLLTVSFFFGCDNDGSLHKNGRCTGVKRNIIAIVIEMIKKLFKNVHSNFLVVVIILISKKKLSESQSNVKAQLKMELKQNQLLS